MSWALVKSICNELSGELRKVLGQARKDYQRAMGKCLPAVFTIMMHDCELNASSNARLLYILSDDSAVNWLLEGLHRAVMVYLEVELRAISHTASPSDSDQRFPMQSGRYGVRGKVHWKAQYSSWRLEFAGAPGADKKYCKEHKIDLSVSQKVDHKMYGELRIKAFHEACKVWNAVDQSGKKPIEIVPQNLNVETVPVLHSEPIRQTDSDHEFEAASGDEGEVLCDKQQPMREW